MDTVSGVRNQEFILKYKRSTILEDSGRPILLNGFGNGTRHVVLVVLEFRIQGVHWKAKKGPDGELSCYGWVRLR